MVYAEQFGAMLPSFDDRYADHADRLVLGTIGEEEKGAEHWTRVDAPSIGDVVLMRVGGQESHVGVYVGAGRMLHTMLGVASCIDRMDGPRWQNRIVGSYRWCGPVEVRSRGVFHGKHETRQVPQGLTLEEIVSLTRVDPNRAVVRVGDVAVPREWWSCVRPRAGRLVTIVDVPQDGGGSDGMRIVAMLAVIAVAVAAPYALGLTASVVTAAGTATVLTTGGALVMGGVALAGMLAVNTLIPPASSRLSEVSAASARNTITGTRNEMRAYAPVPVVFGRHRLAPYYAARPYTESAGDDQYLRALFVCGYGPLSIEDIRIGETPIAEFDGVQIEVREGWPDDEPISLYTQTIREEGFAIPLREVEGFTTRRSHADAEELAVDVAFPAGLRYVNDSGEFELVRVDCEVEYSVAGSNDWKRINAASPANEREMAHLFRTSDTTALTSGETSASILWGALWAARPPYLPSGGFAWEAVGYVEFATAGVWSIGVDGSDAIEVAVGGAVVASWYGMHGAANASTPDYAAHSGTINIETPGLYPIRVRVEARSYNIGAAAVGWKAPGGGWQTIPAASLRVNTTEPTRTGYTYRVVSTLAYSSTIVTEAASTDAIRKTITWSVPKGQYDVRVRRVTVDHSTTRWASLSYWTALRSVEYVDPVRLQGLAKIALRIKATDQLNGVIENLNCLCTSVLPDYDAASASWVYRGTSNPASIVRAILTSGANVRPIGESRIDSASFVEFWQWCNDKGFAYNAVLTDTGTVWQRAQDVASAGRGSMSVNDSRYGVMIDKPRSIVVQHFTPRNSWGFRGRKAFPDIPHAIRIRFIDETNDYQEAERTVYADGYDETNATRYETMELFGTTSPDLVWKHGRYYWAAMTLRPETFELSVDFENLICTRGDLVLVTHDVAMFGQKGARIARQLIDDDGKLWAVVLDDPVTMDDDSAWTLRVRLSDGSTWTMGVLVEPGETTTLKLLTRVPSGQPRPEAGDLAMFGRSTIETREMVVKSIAPDRNLCARLTLVDHAPAIHEADQGEIPPYDPGVNRDADWNDGPETPVITDVRSDEGVMIEAEDGTAIPRIVVSLKAQTGVRPLATHAQVKLRLKPDGVDDPGGPYQSRPTVPIEGNTVPIDGVNEGSTYQCKLRTITATGLASRWVLFEHTVTGRSTLPPAASTFTVERLSDGTRRYSWSIDNPPNDLAGVQIRYGAQGLEWDQLTPLHIGTLDASPWESTEPPPGTWTFGLRVFDTAGNQSSDVVYADVTLGSSRLDDVAVLEDAAVMLWPGAKTGCYVTATNTLEATDSMTWDTLAAYGSGTWDTWTRWSFAPTSPIVYQHSAVDAGFLFEFSPDVVSQTLGRTTVEVSWSAEAIAWSAWTEITIARQLSVRARYLRARVTVYADASNPVPTVSQFVVMMRAPTITHAINDLDTTSNTIRERFGAGDIRLPVPPNLFAEIQSVVLSFNGVPHNWAQIDRDPIIGPRVQIFDAQSGEAEDAIVDAIIRGIRSTDGPPSGFVLTPDAGDAVFDAEGSALIPALL